MANQSREKMALEALTVLLDLADHKDICIATQRGMIDFCNWEKEHSARYAELINKIYSGKHARRPKQEPCETNVWFDRKAFEAARDKNKREVV